MPRRAQWDRTAVRDLARSQHHLVTAAQLLQLGVPRSTIYQPDDVGSMFSWVLPGVHRVDGRGDLSADQRDCAALMYSGAGAALTGATKLCRVGVRAARHPAIQTGFVHTLIPHERRRASHGFVQVERTSVPYAVRPVHGFACVTNARAVIDACRRCTEEEAARALVFEVIQRRFSTVEALEREHHQAQIRGSRFVRRALEEVAGGARSLPEGDVRRAFIEAGWTRLVYNAVLETPEGVFIACPDVYDPETGVCLDVDSREFHFDVASWEATMARHARMTSYGLAVLHAPPSRAARDMAGVVDEVARAIRLREGHPVPPVRVRRSSPLSA
jgi:hypothetical protein